MARGPHALTLGEIAALWENARCYDRWGRARGPIAVARLEVLRIGWGWGPPFTLVTESGATLTLTTASPAAVRAAATEAVRRGLARALVRKVDPAAPDAAPVVNEVLQAATAPRGVRPRAKACMRALFCGGIWTQAERHAHGYAASSECVHCGLPGSVHHRLGVCGHEAAVAARKRRVTAEVVRRAVAAGENDRLIHPRVGGVQSRRFRRPCEPRRREARHRNPRRPGGVQRPLGVLRQCWPRSRYRMHGRFVRAARGT